VPLAPEVATVLAKLSQRERFTGEDEQSRRRHRTLV